MFKALRKDCNGRRYSAIVRDSKVKIHYALRKVIPAPDGRPPFAFKTAYHAKQFIRNHLAQMEKADTGFDFPGFEVEVWECKATGVKPLKLVTCNWYCIEGIRRFWELLRKQGEDGLGYAAGGSKAPEGTVSCQTIRLVRKVA